jgi:hypothetical protein
VWYRIVVRDHDLEGGDPYLYTLTTTWHAVVDAHEPNDTRDDAVPLALGRTVNGTLFAGFTSAEVPDGDPYDDWFSVDLAAGSFVAQLDDVATDARVSLTLYDDSNAEVASNYTGTPGESLTLEAEDLTAGTYTLRLGQFGLDVPHTTGDSPELPDHATRMYALTVTQ